MILKVGESDIHGRQKWRLYDNLSNVTFVHLGRVQPAWAVEEHNPYLSTSPYHDEDEIDKVDYYLVRAIRTTDNDELHFLIGTEAYIMTDEGRTLEIIRSASL